MTTITSAQQRIIVVQPKQSVQVVGAVPGPQGPAGPVGPQGPQGPYGGAPTGTMMMFAGTLEPEGYLFCDGSAKDRVLFAALFNVIGTTFGAGDGSTTFNVPDLRNRFPVGLGPTAFSDVLGEVGGSKDAVAVTHGHAASSGTPSNNTSGTPSNNTSGAPSTASTGAPSTASTGTQSANHTHSANPPSTNVGFGSAPTQGGSVVGFMVAQSTRVNANASARTVPLLVGSSSQGWQFGWYSDTTPQVDIGAFNTGGNSVGHSHSMQSHTHSMQSHTHSLQSHTHSLQSHTHSVTVNSAGESGADKNLPPYLTVNFIIKT